MEWNTSKLQLDFGGNNPKSDMCPQVPWSKVEENGIWGWSYHREKGELSWPTHKDSPIII
jgi:hypothetical protein